MLYSLIRSVLFLLPPEQAHNVALKGIDLIPSALKPQRIEDPVEVMGLRFPNRVGLAAGLDKDAKHVYGLAKLGFGFVEVGTLTPRAQMGNPKPRLFRLPKARAIINRMGFNNEGVDRAVVRLSRRPHDLVIGVNIGKNKDTPNDDAARDYIYGLNSVWPVADYITVNVSSPNTPDLRQLQFGEELRRLLDLLKEQQALLEQEYGFYRPILLKVAPDLEERDISRIAQAVSESGMDGLIATNTTISRDGVSGLRHADEAGGLSGAPLTDKSTEVIRSFRSALPARIPIIGAGGIMDGESAAQKIRAGASLVQLYTGLVYRGPKLVTEAALACRDACENRQ